MASLFGEIKLREVAALLPIPDLEAKIQILLTWHDDYHNQTLKSDNETQREQAYNRDMFGKVLGYVDKPSRPFTFEAKSSTDSGQIPDARIGWFDATNAVERTIAVVELKGASISLDKPQKNHGNQSPVQQGFKYRPQYRGCEFVIVSNFFEFRLYNDNQLDFEAWTLDDLVDATDDYINFRIFYLLLASERFVAPIGATPTQEMLLDIRGEQEAIGRRFYLEYRQARADLISNIWLLNEHTHDDSSIAIDKAQKVVDRIVFACFAEDRGLLPEKTVARVLRDAEGSSFGSLWSGFRGFFEAIDLGSEKLGIPHGYNGGLFAADSDLDSLKIGDKALRSLATLSNYDFVEDLSVSILGHIFEQSVSDLEEIAAAATAAGSLSDTILSQRKMGGIYYTPEHVVRSIVEGSLGRYLREAEARFVTANGLKSTLQDKTYADRERVAYLQYREFLHNITVLDPACGSGAFLVGALDFLKAEHERVTKIVGDDLLGGDDFVKVILQQNLFGVDVNAGSVEITKLSLWLKSARKDHKLTTLDGNIRCGNSLITDPNVAGDRAFDWSAAFPAIMRRGGFDVVIGNPPYVDSETMVRSSPEERAHLSKKYKTASGNWDLFVPFYQHAFDLTRAGGVCAMIVPNKIVSAPYAKALRQYVGKNGSLIALQDVSRHAIFDVDVYPVIVTSRKGATKASTVEIAVGLGVNNPPDELPLPADGDWAALFNVVTASANIALSSIADTHSAASVAEAYELKAVLRDDDAVGGRLKVVNTGTLDPYTDDWGLRPMRYIKETYLYPVVAVSDLPKAKDWLNVASVVVAGMAQTIEAAVFEPKSYLPAKSTVVVTSKDEKLSAYALGALLNSTSFRTRFVAANQFAAMAGGYLTITKSNLASSMVPADTQSIAQELDRLGRLATSEKKTLHSVTRTLRSVIVSEFGANVWSKSFKSWWALSFDQFVATLGVSMSLDRKAEFLAFHDKHRNEALQHVLAFDECCLGIDDLVAKAYAVDAI